MTTATLTPATAADYAPIVKVADYFSQPGRPPFRYHETEGGSYASDGFRLWWDCPDEELPDGTRALIPDGDTVPFEMDPPLLAFLKAVDKLKPKPIRVALRPDHWSTKQQWAYDLDWTACRFDRPPPISMEGYGLNVRYLLETLRYLLGRKMLGTVSIAQAKPSGPVLLTTDDRRALIMPIRVEE